jgi:hypothetical protein
MRLLNTRDGVVTSFAGDVPPYAVLSHRWEEEEVTLQDLGSPEIDHGRRLKGFRKLEWSAAVAAGNGLEYLWIDTCWLVVV